jgi:cobalt-zinc-cadmium efflux system protein
MEVMGHDHSHGPHGHSHHHALSPKVLVWSLSLTAAFVVVEATAGFRAHSLALLSDAAHNVSDVFALLLAAIAVFLQARPADHTRTYGYQRAGVLAAFVNALALMGIAVFLFYESWQRLRNPEPVATGVMMWVAAAGLALNTGIAVGLGGHGHDLNVRAAWIHMVGDAASCVAIIVGAMVIRSTGWLLLDPVLSIAIGLAVVLSGWGVIRDSLNILLEGLPKGLHLSDVAGEMRKLPGVIDVHDLHIWSLGSSAHALSSHVLIEDMPPSSSDSILREINRLCCDRFAIHHTTIQFEHAPCVLAEESCTSMRQHQH